MKKFSSMILVLIAAFAGWSCNDDETDNIPSATPKVNLERGTVTANSIEFTLTTENAEKCSYMLLEGNSSEDPILTAEEILRQGTAVNLPAEGLKISLDNLKSETHYRILAVAAHRNTFSAISSLKVTTLSAKEPEPAYETAIKASSALGLYYISFTDDQIGNYMIKLSDIKFDEYGYAMNAGHSFTLDLYATLTDNVMDARLPEGTYLYDAESTGQLFSFAKSSSKIEQTDENGYPKGEPFYITGGEVRVRHIKSGYDITGYLQDEQNNTYKVTFQGKMVIANKTNTIGGDVEVENMQVNYARYYGQIDHNNIGNYYLSFGTTGVDPTDPTTALGNGWMIRLDLWGDISQNDDKARLPEGIYTLTDTHNKGDMSTENTDVAFYFLTGKTPERTEYSLSQGTATVSHHGDNYRIDVHLTMDDQSKIHFIYEGELKFENHAEPLIGDTDATFTIAKCDYHGNQHKIDSDNYILRLASDEQEHVFVNIDLSTLVAENVIDPIIPDGDYTVGEVGQHTSGTFDPGYLFSGYLAGTNIGKKNDSGEITSYALINGGTINFSHTGSVYKIMLDCTTTDNFKITGNYTGELPIENKVAGPEIGTVNFTAGYAPFAYYYGPRTAEDGSNYYYYLLTFSSIKMEGTYNGIYPANKEAGYAAIICLYAATEPQTDLRTPEGTYTSTRSPRGLTWDLTVSEGRSYDAEGNCKTAVFDSGEITITHEDDGYNITFKAKTLRQEDFSFTYKGSFPMNGNGTASPAIKDYSFLNLYANLSPYPVLHDQIFLHALHASKDERILRLPAMRRIVRFSKEIGIK